MVDIQSSAAEIRRGKKRTKKKETTGQKYNGLPYIIYGGHKKKPQGKNIMSASATQGGHN